MTYSLHPSSPARTSGPFTSPPPVTPSPISFYLVARYSPDDPYTVIPIQPPDFPSGHINSPLSRRGYRTYEEASLVARMLNDQATIRRRTISRRGTPNTSITDRINKVLANLDHSFDDALDNARNYLRDVEALDTLSSQPRGQAQGRVASPPVTKGGCHPGYTTPSPVPAHHGPHFTYPDGTPFTDTTIPFGTIINCTFGPDEGVRLTLVCDRGREEAFLISSFGFVYGGFRIPHQGEMFPLTSLAPLITNRTSDLNDSVFVIHLPSER